MSFIDTGHWKWGNVPAHSCQYVFRCDDGDPKKMGVVIQDLTQHESYETISYATFAKYADLDTLQDPNPKYRISCKNNWGVAFFRGRLPSGIPVLVLDWSGFNYVFIPDQLIDEFSLDNEYTCAVSSPSDYLDFMNGDCAVYAHELAKQTGLPLLGLYDKKGLLHHVFVYDESTDTAYDARGAMSLNDVAKGVIGDANEIYEIDLDEIDEQLSLNYTREEREYVSLLM